MLKLLLKNDGKMGRYKWSKPRVKNRPKLCQKWPPKISSKNGLKIDFRGGGPGGSKWSKIDVGDPGGQNINFLKFRTFLQKLSTFGPPKSTPKMAPIKMSFPTNRLYFCSNGGPKMSLFRGSGGGPLGPKNVDTTI
jgi:hypothetical protein